MQSHKYIHTHTNTKTYIYEYTYRAKGETRQDLKSKRAQPYSDATYQAVAAVHRVSLQFPRR